MARDIRLNKGNLGAVAQAAHSVKPGSWFNVFNEFRINNMLSGPFTLAANAATNGLKTLLMPAEKYLAGTIMRDDVVQREPSTPSPACSATGTTASVWRKRRGRWRTTSSTGWAERWKPIRRR